MFWRSYYFVKRVVKGFIRFCDRLGYFIRTFGKTLFYLVLIYVIISGVLKSLF